MYFRAMLRLGASEPWQDALEVLTGTRSFDAQPLMEYFRPIHEWLREENEKSGDVGWDESACDVYDQWLNGGENLKTSSHLLLLLIHQPRVVSLL